MNFLTVFALIVIGVFLFELIILFHEGGHFVSAKLSGVQVNEFALGMGPKLFGFKIGETQYSLRLLPIGGYCAMEAEDEESENPRAFTNAKLWKRMIIIVAGAFMNIVLGLIFMFVIVVQSPTFSSTTVSGFQYSSYSANCGLQEGDKLKEIDGYNIYSANDISYAISTIKYSEYDGTTLNIYKQDCSSSLAKIYSEISTMESITQADASDTDANNKFLKILNEGSSKIYSSSSKKQAYNYLNTYSEKLYKLAGIKNFDSPVITQKDTRIRYRADVLVERNGEDVLLEDVDFFTYKSDEDENPKVAIDFYVEPVEKTVTSVISQTFTQTVSVVRMIWDSLIGLISGQFGINDISGPVGAASVVTQVASEGLKSGFLDAVNNIIYIMMFISVNLGIFNMLPFPALDGGRFLFLLIEGIFKKPIPRKAESVINAVGLCILLLFMLLITFKDVWQLLSN